MSRHNRHFFIGTLCAFLLTLSSVSPVHAQDGNTVTAWDLIALVNGIRTGNGLPALEVNSILMGTAQSTAEIMAANKLTWHIGDVRGRVMAAGYGGGATAWATENFAIGPMSLQDITWIWSDADHMIPMVKPAYQHIGAGVATAADGSVYYIVQAAYVSGSAPYRTQTPGNALTPAATNAAPQWIMPVVTATPGADGTVIHEVQMGQSLWSIAIAYDTHIVDILRYNNMSPEQQVVQIGQKLKIPVTSLPATPTAEITLTPVKVAAVNIDPQLQPTSPLEPSVQASPTISITPTSLETEPYGNNREDLTIPVVLGGIFIAGVILIMIGLLSKRSRVSPDD